MPVRTVRVECEVTEMRDFLRRHGLLFVGLAPVVVFFLLPLEGQESTVWMTLVWWGGFICVGVYVFRQIQAVRRRDQKLPPSDGKS